MKCLGMKWIGAEFSNDFIFQRRGGFYLVKWRDDNVSWDSTWEPIKNLAGCERELRQFYLQRMKDHGEASDEM